MDDIFKIAKQLRKDNQNVVGDKCGWRQMWLETNVVGDKCVKDDPGNFSFDNEAKKVAWKQHYV